MPGEPNTCVELKDSVDAEFDFSTGSARRWFVVGLTAIGPAMPPGFPSVGDPHPVYTSLLCDRVGVGERLSPGATKMYALYSNNGRFRSRSQRVPDDLTRGYLSLAPKKADVSIPFFVATKRLVPKYTTIASGPNAGGRLLSGTGVSWEWVPTPLKTQTEKWQITRDVYLNFLDGPTLEIILSQIGNIHQIPSGGLWMYEAPDIRQTAPNIWRVGYTWWTEEPIPAPGKPSFVPTNADLSANPAVVENFYVTATVPRPTFYAYQVIPAAFEIVSNTSGAVMSVPQVVVFDRFPDRRGDLLGWQGLPGGPLNEYI